MNRNQLLKRWIIQIIAQWALSCMITSIVVAGSFLAKPRGILDRIGMVILFGSLMLGVIGTLLGTKNHVASMYERFTGEEITEVAYNMFVGTVKAVPKWGFFILVGLCAAGVLKTLTGTSAWYMLPFLPIFWKAFKPLFTQVDIHWLPNLNKIGRYHSP